MVSMEEKDRVSLVDISLTASSIQENSSHDSQEGDWSDSFVRPKTTDEEVQLSPQELHMPGSSLPLHIPTPEGYISPLLPRICRHDGE
jgi:hypothetical protein